MPAEYYNNTLYPLQDEAITAFAESPFYLTGGTALSRGYYMHRYSDDLDFFVNYRSDFKIISGLIIEKLIKKFHSVEIDYRGEFFYRIFVGEKKLKIELVNDVPSHIGKLSEHPALGMIDSKENILANKITAVADRGLPKDIVDLYFLLKDGLSIKQSLLDASSKAAGISPLYVAKKITEFDYRLIDEEIKWITPVASDTIKNYLSDLAFAIVEGKI